MSNPVNTPASEQAKAILGGVLAGLTALGTALSDGAVSPVEWVGVLVAALATYGTVFGVRNQPTAGRRNEGGFLRITNSTWPVSNGEWKPPTIPEQRNQRGHVDLAVVLLVGIVVVLVLVLLGRV